MHSFFGLASFRQFSFPYFLATLRFHVVSCRERKLNVALFFVAHQLLRFLVDLWHESRPIIYNNRLLDNEVFFLELPPVLMEQFESSLNCAHILTRHAKLKVIDKESNFMGSINGVFVLRGSVPADRASIVLHAITIAVVSFAIFEVLFLVVLLSVTVLNLIIIVVFLIKEVLLLLLIFLEVV